jgi:aerobic C4-dicarboxylate transport protein
VKSWASSACAADLQGRGRRDRWWFHHPGRHLATLGGKLPVEGLALLIGVDRFMSEARAITNLIGNGVATVVVARWEKALDQDRMQRVLNGEVLPELDAVPAKH